MKRLKRMAAAVATVFLLGGMFVPAYLMGSRAVAQTTAATGGTGSVPPATAAPAAPAVNPEQQVTNPAPANPNDVGGIFSGIVQSVGDWKTAGWQAGLAAFIMLIIGTMKNSFLATYWAKLGNAQTLVPPVLTLIVVLLGLHGHLSWPAIWIALTTGLGATGLHELMDDIKGYPGIGPLYVMLIGMVGKLLQAPPAAPATTPPASS